MGFPLGVRCWSAWLVTSGLLFAACGSDSDGSPAPLAGASEGGSELDGAASDGGKPDGGAAAERGGKPSDGGDASASGAPGSAGGESQLGLLERLENLGAKTDLESDPLDNDDNPVPSGYHPLKRPFAVIEPHQEIYFSGPLLGAQREGMLNDGFSGGFGPLLNAQFTPWLTANYRAAVAGDFDGDGIQEFVSVYYDAPSKKLMAKMIWGPRGNDIAYDEEPFVLVDVATPSNMPDDYFQHAVAAGNVDDDPADELWVGFRNLYVFDDLDHQMAELHRESYDTPYVAVTKGDFDAALADPQDEFFVMYTAFPENVQHYQVFDGLAPQFELGGRILRPTLTNADKSEIGFHQGFAVAGELDGDDPQQEIAILSGDDYRWRLMIMDDAHVNYRTFDSMIIDMTGDNVMLAAADIDGDGVDEVACDRWIFDNLESLPQSGDRTQQDDIYQSTLIPRISTGIFTYQMRGANVTPDYGVPPRRTRQFVTLEWGGRLLYSARNPTSGNQLAWVSLGNVSQQRGGDVLAVGNVDDDSAVVKFTGEHELLYSEPELLVAMAAPPFYAGSNQPANTYTSFGKGTADSVEHESSVGFSVGFSLGYESSDPLGVSKSSFKVSVNQEFDSLAKSKSTLSEWVTYTTGAEDSVVFSVVPFDVYYYEVVSAPDPGQVGKTLSINLPRAPQTLLASSEYFDQFVDETRKSAPLFATHVVGDPLSYADVDGRDALCRGDCFKSKGTISVGQGTGWTQIDISKADAKGVGTSYKLTTEVASEASLFGVSVGASVGFSYGYGLELTTEETTIFTGRLGSLKDLTPETGYNVGLFAHRQAHPASIKPILVVDYWVVQ
jgi:hypothetical protein